MTMLAQLEKSYWTAGTPLPTPRSKIAGTVLNDKIYIVGGFDSSERNTPMIDVYDPILDEWTQVTLLPQPLDHAAAAAYHDGKLYIVGGGYLNRDALSDKLMIYDSNTNNGQRVPTYLVLAVH